MTRNSRRSGSGGGGLGSSTYTSIHFGLIGDSFTTTQGESGVNAARAMEQLNKSYGDLHEIYTSGLSGGFLTTAGSPTTQAIFETALTGFAANAPRSDQLPVLIIHCATNDLAAAVSNTTLFTALLALLRSAKSYGLVWKEIFYSTVCPRLGLEAARASWNQYCIDHIAELRAAGLSGHSGTEGLLLVDESPYFAEEAEIDLPGYKTDRTHPSDRGNIVLANLWQQQMEPVLRRRYPKLITRRKKPWDIPGVKVILTANRGVTQSAGLVSNWQDTLTTNGWNFTQGTGAKQFTYSATGGPFGIPIMTLDGARYMDLEAAGLGLSNGEGKLSVIAAGRVSTLQTSHLAWIGRGTASTSNARAAVGYFLTTHFLSYAERLDAETSGVQQWTMNTGVSDTFVDANVTTATDTVTLGTHPFVTGDIGRFTTTGVVPTGLATGSNNYYTRRVNDNDVTFHTTKGGANTDTSKVDITAAAGGGTHTFTQYIQPDSLWHIHSQHNDFDNDIYTRYLDGYNIGSAQSSATKGKVDTTNTLVVRIGAGGSAASASSFFIGDIFGVIIGRDLTMGEMHMCEQWLNDEMEGICFRNWGVPV